MRFSRSLLSKLVIVPSFGLAAVFLANSAADAATDDTQLDVSATVVVECTISAAVLDFGQYDANAASTTNTDFTVNCTNNAPVFITLGQGAAPGAGSTDAAPVRQMANGTHRLGYSLYRDSGLTQVWGNTQGTAFSTAGTGADQAVTVYGRIPAGQWVGDGTYTDAVVATINY